MGRSGSAYSRRPFTHRFGGFSEISESYIMAAATTTKPSRPAAATLNVEPMQDVTFTITSMPRNERAIKTLQRLMRLQPTIQRGLRRIATRRKRDDNVIHPRGGREWISRVRVTKLVNPAVGQKFTIHVTPQIVADIKSVEQYLSK